MGTSVSPWREIAEGVNKRDSRKIKRTERNANIYL
jgi:hypothetical protein